MAERKTIYLAAAQVETVTSRRMKLDFRKHLEDWNAGRFSDVNNLIIENVSVYLNNPTINVTYNCTVEVVGLITRSISFTARSTTSRFVVDQMGYYTTPTNFFNILMANGGYIYINITGDSAYYGNAYISGISIDPWLYYATDTTKYISNVSVSTNDISNQIVVSSQSPSTTGMFIKVFESINGEDSLIYQTTSDTRVCNIPPFTISDTSKDIHFEYGVSKGYVSINGVTVLQSPVCTYAFNGLTITLPQVTNLDTIGQFWEQPIIVNWRADNQSGYEYECYYNNNLVKSGVGGIEKTFTLPSNTYSGTLGASIRVRPYRENNGIKYYGSWAEKTLSLKDIEATISDVSTIGELWEQPIKVAWNSVNQEQFKIEVFKDSQLVKTYTGTTAKEYTIPANQLSNGTHTIKVWVGYQNRFVNSVNKSITLRDIIATISNLIISDSYYEKPILLSWRSENQQQFRVEVLKNNTVVKTYTGTTATTYTIPADQLTSGEHAIRVTVAYANRYVNSTEKNVTLVDVKAIVQDLALSGSSIDLPLTFSWASTDQQAYEYEIYKDAARVKNGSGTTTTSISIANNTLTTGLHKFMVRVAYKSRWTTWEEINVNLVETLPSIGVLEPDGVIVDKDYPIRIWWTSQNQSKWKVILDGGSPIEGTWQTEYIVPAATLQTGKHTINLTVTYVTSKGIEKIAFKNAEFIVQGKPPIPTFTNSNLFTTSRPTLSWDTQDQQGYILEILKDDVLVWTTEWQNGLVTRQKVLDYLPNGTYVAKLKIINQFSIESDYGKMTFTVNATESTAITLDAQKIGNAISLSWNNIAYKFEKFYIIRNGCIIGTTTDTIYTDYTAFGSCNYIIRGVNASDIYKDSNIAIVDFIVDYSVVATIDALDDMLNVSISNEQYAFNGNLEVANSIMHMSGRVLPVFVFGAHETNTFDIVFNQKNLDKFKEMLRRRQVFCYRDKHEKLFLSISNPSYDIDVTGYKVRVSGTETDYSEVVEYD